MSAGAPALHDAWILLGALPRRQAIEFLVSNCVNDPPLDVAEADALWRTYRGRLAARGATDREAPAAAGDTIALASLRVVQHVVLVDRVQEYAMQLEDECAWAPLCAGKKAGRNTATIQFRRSHRHGNYYVDLPHFEYSLELDESARIHVLEGHQGVIGSRVDGHVLLMAGHHRALARLVAMGRHRRDSIEFQTDPGPARAAVAQWGEDDRDFSPAGRSGACLADYLDPQLRFETRLRHRTRRLELQVVQHYVG